MQLATKPPEVSAQDHQTAVRKLKKAKIDLMRSTNPALRMYSGILMLGSTKVDDSVPSAYTNGRDEVYGTRFILELKPKELAFVVLHEALHKAFRHMTIWRALSKIDHPLTNAAADYVINLIAVQADPNEQTIAMPRRADGSLIGLLDKRFAGMNTKQVWDILREEGYESKGPNGFDEHDWDGAQEIPSDEQEELERDITTALRQGAMEARKLAGNGGGGLPRELEDLLNPQLDWRDVLNEFVTSICLNKDQSSWQRVSRRFIANDVYMPSLIGQSVGRIVVGVDTSGSVSNEDLTKFLSEIVDLCNAVSPDALDLLYWDGDVDGHEQFHAGSYADLLTGTRPIGGGGTDPNCVSKYLAKNQIAPECIVMFTDGYVPNWGSDWPAPILWVVVNNAKAQADVGKTIHIN